MIKEHRILTDALDVTVGWPSDGSGKREIEHDVENRCVQDIHPSYLFMKIPTTPLPIFPVCRIILSFVIKKRHRRKTQIQDDLYYKLPN
jgi:hypothetical protein